MSSNPTYAVMPGIPRTPIAVETGTERLAELRDNFASAMDETAAEQYEHEFNHAVQVRLPRFALGIENV